MHLEAKCASSKRGSEGQTISYAKLWISAAQKSV